jgi:hypothetical protein
MLQSSLSHLARVFTIFTTAKQMSTPAPEKTETAQYVKNIDNCAKIVEVFQQW